MLPCQTIQWSRSQNTGELITYHQDKSFHYWFCYSCVLNQCKWVINLNSVLIENIPLVCDKRSLSPHCVVGLATALFLPSAAKDTRKSHCCCGLWGSYLETQNSGWGSESSKMKAGSWKNISQNQIIYEVWYSGTTWRSLYFRPINITFYFCLPSETGKKWLLN